MTTKYIAVAFLALVPSAGIAQDQLSKEITVEREIVPEVRAASRLDLYPRQLNFTPATKTLDYSDRSLRGAVNPGISTLEPAATEAAAPSIPYRGYLDAGYFPAANASVSAGYAIVDGDATHLNAWTQLDNVSNKGCPVSGGSKETFRNFTGRVGVGFSHKFSPENVLEIGTRVGFASFLQPWSVLAHSIDASTGTQSQNVLQWDVDAAWRGRASGSLMYHVNAGFGLFNFSEGLSMDAADKVVPAVHQTGMDFDMGVEQQIDGASSAGVDLTGDILSYNHFYRMTDDGEPDTSGKTLGVMSLKPFYRWGNKVVSLKAGVRLDLTVNAGKAFHIAPDVMLAVNPASGFGAWLRLGGGEHINSLQSLAAFSPYLSQAAAYGVSDMPVTGSLGFRFGPLKGVSLTATLDYAAANNWLLPYEDSGVLLFAPVDLRAWKAGARINWNYRKLLSVEAAFESTLGNDEKGTWIEWRDRARHVLSVSASVRPFEKLSIEVGYSLRMKRSMPSTTWHAIAENAVPGTIISDYDLKDCGNLHAGVSYAVTQSFSVFARGENLTDKSYSLLPFVPAQGITGLVGVGLKF